MILSAHDSERLWMLVCSFESDDAELVNEYAFCLSACKCFFLLLFQCCVGDSHVGSLEINL